MPTNTNNLVVKCTACSCIIDYNDSTALSQHPILRVLLCSLCLKRTMEMVSRKEPETEYCLWCSQRQNLVCCSACPKSFCIECIERNLGAAELANIEQKNWRCYACHPAPLEELVSFSEMMMDYGDDDDDDDSDMEGDLQKQLERECWLDYHMDNVRHQIEDVGEHLYHLKIKLRRERALCNGKDLDSTSNKFLERVEIILLELMKNIKMMIVTLRTKKPKPAPVTTVAVMKDFGKVMKREVHDPSQQIDKNKGQLQLEKKIQTFSPQQKYVKREEQQKISPVVSKIKTTVPVAVNVVRTTSATIKPNPCMSPPSIKLYHNILQNPEIMVRSHPSPMPQQNKPKPEIHKVVIKEEPLSPQHDDSLHDPSPEPPKMQMVPAPVSKMAKTKVASARLKHSEKKVKPMVQTFENSMESSMKPVGQQEPAAAMMNVVIKQEPPEETSEDHHEDDSMFPENKVVEKRPHIVVKQEPVDESEKSMDAAHSPQFTKKFKYSDPEEDADYSASKNTKLLEELMSRKDLSIQPTQQQQQHKVTVVTTSADVATIYTTQVGPPQKLATFKQQHMLADAEEEEEDEDHHQHHVTMFDQDTPTKLPPGIEYSQLHPRAVNRQSMSAVIDLLKGDSSLSMAPDYRMSEDEDLSDQGESAATTAANKDEEMVVESIKREPLDHEEEEEFLEEGQQYNHSLAAGRASPQGIDDSFDGSSEAQQHICKECGQTFSSFKLLVHHAKQKHGALAPTEKQRPYKCGQCPYSSEKIANLRSHMRTHQDARPFSCVFCEKSFKLASNLNKHMKLHTEEKVYVCRDCQQKFPTAGKLKKHRVEGGCPALNANSNSSAVNQCQYCDKTFPDVEQLNGHVLTHFVTDGNSYTATTS